MNAQDVIRTARRWLGTRWQHQASLRGVGTDCIGLVAGVARELGLAEVREFDAIAELHTYGRQPDPVMLLAACNRFLDRAEGDLRVGDIMVLRFDQEPQHFAFVSALSPDYMIHAYAQARKVVENGIDATWLARLFGIDRFRGLDG